MSYDIYIGQAVFEELEPEEIAEGLLPQLRVNRTEQPDAPTFSNDEMTGNGNSRHPAYSTWHDVTKIVGLEDLFFNKKTGLMREHPGCFRLTNEHYNQIAAALERYQSRHPKAKPGFSDELDGVLARLIWLEWWVRWALANCKAPSIYNH